jgi:hypothetical protein
LLLLNLATADWDEAARKLKIDVKDLKYLRPRPAVQSVCWRRDKSRSSSKFIFELHSRLERYA